MLSARQIEVFYHVYKESSLTKAAKVLRVSQPLISKTLSYAEHKLNFQLFVRHARRISPTPEADILFKHAASVNSEIIQFNTIAKNLLADSSGVINIGCTPSLGLGLLPTIIRDYLSGHPGTKFNITNLQSLELEAQLKELTFDLIISYNPQSSELFNKVILHSGSLVLISPLSNAPQHQTVPLSSMTREPFIKIKNMNSNSVNQELDVFLDNNQISLNWVAETETMQVAKAMVEKGAGHAIIDDFSAVVHGENISVQAIEPKIGYEISMLSNKEKPLSVNAKSFIEFISKTES